jgi:hypothetical protein
MANTNSRFNPAYSTIKSISLLATANSDPDSGFDIVKQNTQCRYERLELVENINDVLPSGCLIVTDLQDIVTFANGFQNISIGFFSGEPIKGSITSISYINNAASDSDETMVAIYFTNSYYKYFSSKSLSALLTYKKPIVHTVDEFVTQLKHTFGSTGRGYEDSATNYFLYKPLTPYNTGDETTPDNAIEMMNYLSTGAIDANGDPNFLFWTSFDGAVNFKSFKREITSDPNYANANNIAVYDGDSVIQKLSDGKVYRKAYFVASNPAVQWISKNYYYIRKTPKYLDSIILDSGSSGFTGSDLEIAQQSTTLKNLTFQFQDDGQKYNIDIVSVDGRGTVAPDGGDHIIPENSWGYYDPTIPTNDKSIPNMLSNQYGTDLNYKNLNFMGLKEVMPFLDSPDMWKNMFDLTPIHPHYPDQQSITPGSILSGDATNLQKVIDIRYEVFAGASGPSGASAAASRLEEIRKIEAQNFVMYSLCCMGKKEDCFFAVLQRYEPDNTYYGVTGASDPIFPGSAKFYRYKWNKILFGPGYEGVTCGTCGSSGASGASGGASGATAYSHRLEKWCLDPTTKSSDTQDDTWAINLNERGLSGAYLPPGWVSPSLSSFKFRPIGSTINATFGSNGGDISHIARVCIEQIDAKTRVTSFWIENVLDGTC